MDSALSRLVESGELTQLQAQHVHESLDLAFAEQAPATPAPAPRSTHWATRLIEVGAYLGAALVAAGGALVIGQHWDELGRTGQLWLLTALTVAFAVAGCVVAAVRSRSTVSELAATWRRLASTLLTLAAAAGVGFVAVWFIPERGDLSDNRAGTMFLIMAAVSAVFTLLARFIAPSAFAELALYGAALIGGTGVMFLIGPPETPTPSLIGFFALGVAWAALAQLTSAFTVPTLATCLGLVTAVITGLGDSTTNEVLAGTLAVGALAAYLVRPRWPLIAAAMVAVVALTFELVGGAFGSAMAFLVAGVVLLVLATLGVVWRRHARPAPR